MDPRMAYQRGEGWILDKVPIVGTKKKFREFMFRLGLSTDQVDKLMHEYFENQKESLPIEDKIMDDFIHQDTKYEAGE